MSQNRYRRPLDLEPGASRRAALVLAGMHLLAALALLLPLDAGLFPRLSILCAILLSARHQLREAPHNRIRRGCWRQDGQFELQLRDGRRLRASLAAGSLASEWLVILHLETRQGRHYRWLLLPDMLGAETWRRLCVRLRQWHH